MMNTDREVKPLKSWDIQEQLVKVGGKVVKVIDL
jgi:hypothetical protein